MKIYVARDRQEPDVYTLSLSPMKDIQGCWCGESVICMDGRESPPPPGIRPGEQREFELKELPDA